MSMLFRASQIFKIMGRPQSIDTEFITPEIAKLMASRPTKDEAKAEKTAILEPLYEQSLSAGAKTELTSMAKQFVYGYRPDIDTKQMRKGIMLEDDGIALYNNVFFTNYQKNKTRKNNTFFTGECDILVPAVKTLDIKLAWSLETFIATSERLAQHCKESGYDYQGQVYNILEDVQEHEVAMIMLSTPEDLRRYEAAAIHEVNHIDPALRVTRCTFKRDPAIEALMIVKVKAARKYLTQEIETIQRDHQH